MPGSRRITPRDVPQSPKWLIGLSCVPLIAGFAVAISSLPWTQDHSGLTLCSLILPGFLWWLLSSLLKGCYQSKQGTYDCRSSPVRYWVHVAILSGANVLLGYGWVTYCLLLTLK